MRGELVSTTGYAQAELKWANVQVWIECFEFICKLTMETPEIVKACCELLHILWRICWWASQDR